MNDVVVYGPPTIACYTVRVSSAELNRSAFFLQLLEIEQVKSASPLALAYLTLIQKYPQKTLFLSPFACFSYVFASALLSTFSHDVDSRKRLLPPVLKEPP